MSLFPHDPPPSVNKTKYKNIIHGNIAIHNIYTDIFIREKAPPLDEGFGAVFKRSFHPRLDVGLASPSQLVLDFLASPLPPQPPPPPPQHRTHNPGGKPDRTSFLFAIRTGLEYQPYLRYFFFLHSFESLSVIHIAPLSCVFQTLI